MPRLRSTVHGGLVTGRHVGQNRLKTVSGRSHAWFRNFGAQTFLVFESREETQIRPIVQGGKKDFFLLLLLDQAGEFLGPKQQLVRGCWVQPIIFFLLFLSFCFFFDSAPFSYSVLSSSSTCMRELFLAFLYFHPIVFF